MFSDKSQLVAAYAEVCVGLKTLSSVRAKQKIMNKIDIDTRQRLSTAFEALYDWQDELVKAIKENS